MLSLHKDGMEWCNNMEHPFTRGFTCLQADNTVSVGNSSFISGESETASRLDRKPPKSLQCTETVIFSDASTKLITGLCELYQPDHVRPLAALPEGKHDTKTFVCKRARKA